VKESRERASQSKSTIAFILMEISLANILPQGMHAQVGLGLEDNYLIKSGILSEDIRHVIM
jgi:hypothetical protein